MEKFAKNSSKAKNSSMCGMLMREANRCNQGLLQKCTGVMSFENILRSKKASDSIGAVIILIHVRGKKFQISCIISALRNFCKNLTTISSSSSECNLNIHSKLIINSACEYGEW